MSMLKKELLSFTSNQLEHELSRLGQPKYRATQLFDWLHGKRIDDIDKASNLPSSLRERLHEEFSFEYPRIIKQLQDAEGTQKFLLRYADGNAVEAVLMHYRDWDSLCISTQFGCKMGCTFCASTGIDFIRNMTTSELLSQVYTIASLCERPPKRLVLMGVGEPLDNYDNVVDFLRLLGDEKGYNISMRNVSLSTCGIIPKIEQLMDEGLPLTLSISLHRTTQETRAQVMPIANAYDLTSLIEVCKRYEHTTGRRISYEYAVVAGENDTLQDAKRLADLLRGSAAHVNLIPLNSGDDTHRHGFAAKQFLQLLEREGLSATVRRTLGADIDAACGQLRRSYDA